VGGTHSDTRVSLRSAQESQKLIDVANKGNEVLQYIVRGVEQYAHWHHLNISDVVIHRAFWTCDDKLVIEFDRAITEEEQEKDNEEFKRELAKHLTHKRVF
jgi:hypothetical protein